MLTQLHIKNFALIENLSLEFSGKLNVLTGETGAGKSILIDAIRFVLGERMDGLRGADQAAACFVEAAFEAGEDFLKAHPVFEPYLEEEGLLVLRREHAQGKSRAWINNRLVALAQLKEAGSCLIDIHGQYDHQLLLDGKSHMALTDRLAGNADLLRAYGLLYEQYRALAGETEEIARLEEHKERELDLLKYQIQEIERAEISDMDEDALDHERIRLANAEKLSEAATRALSVLDEQDVSASGLVAEALRDIGALARLDGSMEKFKGEGEALRYSLLEIISALRDYRENLTFDPARLAEIEKKLDLLEHLKRKYGGSFANVLEFYREAKAKYDRLIDTAVTRRDIEMKMKSLVPQLDALASKLSQKRRKAAELLKRTIESELKDLHILHACFESGIEKTDYAAEGTDRVEFMIRMNPGQPLLPLKKIISGGEASRVMLAMKKALMEVDPIPTLIFDEIDTNIGGRLGQVTGQKLKSIAGERQVLLITHLPQIASFADRHIKVTKAIRKGKTAVSYEILEGDERVRELAQMMSGLRETEISRRHAAEMLNQAS
ncbi:MAG: DNA repair protein RecN [Candidatus Omnitrophota bacterium]|jgi:DNA repair protein RecN (Recombination protein N)